MTIQSTGLLFCMSVESAGALPGYLGPTLRGLFGYTLKQTVCVVDHRRCNQCMLQSVCPYPRVFEGLAPTGRSIMTRYPNVPQPFVLDLPSPESLASDAQELCWGLRLFGDAQDFAPYILESFVRSESKGLGTRRVPFRVREVRDEHSGHLVWSSQAQEYSPPEKQTIPPREIPDKPCTIRWSFETPVHIRSARGMAPTPDGLTILLAGRRRHQLMSHFYGQTINSESNVPQHMSQSAFETKSLSLHPWHIYRFSGRQKRRIPLNGIIGTICIHGPWHLAGDWLQAIESIHLGKYTSFGFGRVRWDIV